MTKVFECTICQKSFTNGKALGGHKSSHKRRGGSDVLIQIESTEATFMCPVCRKGFASARSVCGHMKKHSDRTWRGMIAPGQTRQYACTVCGKSFESYQALGGHKSHHARMGQENAGAIVPYIEQPSCSSRQLVSSNEAPVIHRFDLNKLPSEWTE